MKFDIKRLAKATYMLAAPRTWTASFVPMTVGYVAVFSLETPRLDSLWPLWIIVSYIAMGLIETGKHGVNEIYDYMTGNDLAVDQDHVTPFSGGKKVLVGQVASTIEVAVISAITLGGGALLGLSIVVFQSKYVVVFGLIGIFISVAYSCPPFKLVYRGLGEAAVFVTYGPLITMGAYSVFGQFGHDSVIISLAMSVQIGIIIMNVLLINEYPDYEADLVAGKRNLLCRVGKEKGCIIHLYFFLASYIPILFLSVYTQWLIWLISLALLPLMMKSYRICCKHKNNIASLMQANGMTIVIHAASGLVLIICLVIIRLSCYYR